MHRCIDLTFVPTTVVVVVVFDRFCRGKILVFRSPMIFMSGIGPGSKWNCTLLD